MSTATNELFVPHGSIVRSVWGDADAILLVFAGAAAEFALNRAVDWLFVTERLPRDPIGRLLSTAAFAQRIVFASQAAAEVELARVKSIHAAVERQRGATIPPWAHRDVLYLLIAYSERAFSLLYRPLSVAERDELYAAFQRVGVALGVQELPTSYAEWQIDRQQHLVRDLAWSAYSARLYARYRAVLGPWRYALLCQLQGLIVPPHVRHLLRARTLPGLKLAVPGYRLGRRLGLRPLVQRALILPPYLHAIQQLDHSDGL